jgi:plastocyanin
MGMMLVAMEFPAWRWCRGETRPGRCRMEDRRRAGGPGGQVLRGWLAGAVSLLLLVGCGGGGEPVDASATATTRFSEGMEGLQGGIQRGMPATVTMTDGQQFDPSRVTVPAGTTVLWRNISAVQHTVTADAARAKTASNVQLPSSTDPFESESLTQGQTFARQLTVAGEYRYVCRIHEASGMVGIVTVE